MTEPPRPPGAGDPNDPTAPFNPYANNDPSSGSTPPPPPPYGSPQSAPPSYGGSQPPPSSGYGPPPQPPAGDYGPPGGGYGPPPQPPVGDYGPPGGGYGPPQQPPGGYGYVPQPGYAPTQDDKTWIMIAHFGGAAGALVAAGCGGWIVPLIAYLAKGSQSPAVRAEAVKALNFQILWSIIGVIGWATVCIGIGIVIWAIAALVSIIFGVIAGIKASNNEPYNYPMTVSIIK